MMTRDDWLLVALSGAAGLGLALLDSSDAQAARSPATSPATPPPWHPDTHATATRRSQPRADKLDEATALARVVASEAGDRRHYTDAERLAIAWAVRNRARRRGTTIARMVCAPTCGECCDGRPFSSARAGSADDVALARRVLATPERDDPTHGAAAILEPALQDRLVASGALHYKHDAAEVRASWRARGQQLLATIGRFELWTT